MTKPTIINDTEQPVEIIVSAIAQVAEGARKLLGSRLSKRALLVLIQDAAPGSISLSVIETVLDTAALLDKKFIKKI
jgi:hypothetical protein